MHPVPVVIGNGGQFYVTDHHHLTNALWKTAEGENAAGIETKNARVVVIVQFNRASLMGYPYKYFLNVLAVTATLSAKSVANGNTMKVGWRLNGSAK